ncbi:BTAD domain-containing putative transcriptional regulator [Actinokineospora sp. G85]|uniref:AfsR/SARP family transcriptional regulator n=1 Tax=Actinokineospora sp. G85 TaxID=3406626 RepID=UPI003C716A4B
MRILVLGPVEIRAGDRGIGLGGPKPKALLTALLLQARQVVSTDRLIDVIWDESPPQSATALVHTYVSSIRRALADAGRAGALATRSPGYLLDVAAADSDLESFTQHLDSGRQAERRADLDAAAEHYRLALDLWRGPAFGGVEAGFARVRADGLAEERLGAEEGLARCRLAQGRAGELPGPLRALAAANPLREEVRGLLMRALYETGRQADALAVYREGRKHLLDELGIEPGPGLRELHGEILGGTLEPLGGRAPAEPVRTPAPAPAVVAEPAAAPRNLPPDIGDFTGRDADLATLLRLGDTADADTRRTTPTVVVSGFGGAGKSALAVHAAHLLREQYPDGQLFADLRGSDRDLGAFEVLGRLLGVLGVSGAEQPTTLDERSELFRRTVAGRRVVIVLDNARGEHQVRPLLPGEPRCLVVVTSRSRLTGLEGAEPVELDFFDTGAAVEMLGKIVGRQRVAAQPAAAERIADLCGGIPLAIRAAAAKLLARPHWPLKSLAARLSDEHRRLDELAVGDLAIRSSLRLNYTELDDRQRRAFHLLSVLDLPDFGWWVAAPLLDIPPADAEDVVEQLVDLRLLDVAGVDGIGRVRYRFHDLVQLFGAEHAAVAEPAAAVADAVSRTLRVWMALVEAGSRKLPRATLGLRPNPAAGVEVDPRLVEEVEEDPTEWLKSETAAVVRAVERAHDLGIDGTTTLLITSLLSSSFAARNEFDGWQRTHEVALTAARSGGDRRAEAVVLAGLGQLHYAKDDFGPALDHFTRALAHAAAVDDEATQAVALVGLGTVRRDLADFAQARLDLEAAADLGARTGDHEVVAAADYGLGSIALDHSAVEEAVERFHRSARLYRELGDGRGEALAQRGLSLCHRSRQEHAEAVDLSARAAEFLHAAGDELLAAYARQSWAKAALRLGRTEGLADVLLDCLAVCTSQRDRFGAALMTRTLGELHLAVGDREAAEAALTGALAAWGSWACRCGRPGRCATSPRPTPARPTGTGTAPSPCSPPPGAGRRPNWLVTRPRPGTPTSGPRTWGPVYRRSIGGRAVPGGELEPGGRSSWCRNSDTRGGAHGGDSARHPRRVRCPHHPERDRRARGELVETSRRPWPVQVPPQRARHLPHRLLGLRLDGLGTAGCAHRPLRRPGHRRAGRGERADRVARAARGRRPPAHRGQRPRPARRPVPRMGGQPSDRLLGVRADVRHRRRAPPDHLPLWDRPGALRAAPLPRRDNGAGPGKQPVMVAFSPV